MQNTLKKTHKTYEDTDLTWPPDNGGKLSPILRRFFELQRERTIAELREIDRLLGRAQTIPKRNR